MLKQLLNQYLENQAGKIIEKYVGISPDLLQQSSGDILGSLLGGLAKNVEQGGTSDLLRALDKDHDGSILDDLGGLVSGGTNGSGILKHLLGSQRTVIESYVAKKYNISPSVVSQLFESVAPLVMGVLGKEKTVHGLDGDGIKELLLSEKNLELIQTNPAVLKLLDRDGDGDVDLQDFL